MSLSPKIKLHFFGDSHLCEHHHFHESMNTIRCELEFWRFNEIESKYVHAEPGAIIDLALVDKFGCTLKLEDPSPQVHVFAIGVNNLRRGLRDGQSREASDHVIQLFTRLIQKAEKRENVHLVFCSLVPSPKHEPESSELFWQVNKQLKKLTDKNTKMASFLDLRLVAGADHHAKHDLFSRDKIHLNQQGSLFMANRIIQFLQHIPASLVGVPSREIVYNILKD